MDELLDLMATDESPSTISDKIKDLIFTKSAASVDAFKPEIANSLFGKQEEEDVDGENEVSQDNGEDETE